MDFHQFRDAILDDLAREVPPDTLSVGSAGGRFRKLDLDATAGPAVLFVCPCGVVCASLAKTHTTCAPTAEPNTDDAASGSSEGAPTRPGVVAETARPLLADESTHLDRVRPPRARTLSPGIGEEDPFPPNGTRRESIRVAAFASLDAPTPPMELGPDDGLLLTCPTCGTECSIWTEIPHQYPVPTFKCPVCCQTLRKGWW